MSREKEVSNLLRSPAEVSDTGTSPRKKGAATHSQKKQRQEEGGGRVRGGSSPPFQPLSAVLPRSCRGSSWLGLRSSRPRRLPITSPSRGSPGPGGQQPPRGFPHPPSHTPGGIHAPPSLPQLPRLPNPQLRTPSRRLGRGLRAGRARGSPPPRSVGPGHSEPPVPSAGRSRRPPRCAQVRSAAGRELRAGRGGRAVRPRPRRRAGAARSGAAGASAPGLPGWGRNTGDTHTYFSLSPETELLFSL